MPNPVPISCDQGPQSTWNNLWIPSDYCSRGQMMLIILPTAARYLRNSFWICTKYEFLFTIFSFFAPSWGYQGCQGVWQLSREGGLRRAQWHWLLADGLGSLTQSDFDSFSWWGSQRASLLQDRLEWKPPCQCRGDESPVEDQSLDSQYFMLGEVAQKLSSRRGRKGGHASFVCCFGPEYCLLLLANTVCCPGTWQWGWVKSSALKETYSNNPKKLRREGHYLSLAQMR